MSRRPARFTQADLRRAINVACQFDPPWRVRIMPDGTIDIEASSPKAKKSEGLERKREIVL